MTDLMGAISKIEVVSEPPPFSAGPLRSMALTAPTSSYSSILILGAVVALGSLVLVLATDDNQVRFIGSGLLVILFVFRLTQRLYPRKDQASVGSAFSVLAETSPEPYRIGERLDYRFVVRNRGRQVIDVQRIKISWVHIVDRRKESSSTVRDERHDPERRELPPDHALTISGWVVVPEPIGRGSSDGENYDNLRLTMWLKGCEERDFSLFLPVEVEEVR